MVVVHFIIHAIIWFQVSVTLDYSMQSDGTGSSYIPCWNKDCTDPSCSMTWLLTTAVFMSLPEFPQYLTPVPEELRYLYLVLWKMPDIV